MKIKLKNTLRSFFDLTYISNRRGMGGFVSGLIGWFIRIVIYDICISFIQEAFGVSRFAALFIFLGILAVISFAGYALKQKISPAVDE